MMDVMAATSTAERARRYREYVEALEEEQRKIQVFQRELPLSFHLVTQTIESCRQQMAAELVAAGGSGGPSEIDEEETSSEGGLVLEEFIPIKRSCSSEADDEEEADRSARRPGHDHEKNSNGAVHNDDDCYSTSTEQRQHEPEKKPDWLRSVQLWSQQPDPQPVPMDEEDETPRRPIVVEPKKPTGAFQPFNPRRRSPAPAAAPAEVAPVAAAAPTAPAASSTSETIGPGKGGAGVSDEKDGHPHRKSRRCWSPELHRRFLDALQRLGGSHVATPKQIRELMKVDGLTNDEVKSHLQKYRLHSRRPRSTSQSSGGNPPPQQVVFVGGIWVPPPEYAAAAAAAAVAAAHPPAEGIVASPVYAPIASVPAPVPQRQQVKQGQRSPSGPLPTGRRGSGDEHRSADDDATRSNSPATSSSSRTTTTSPPLGDGVHSDQKS